MRVHQAPDPGGPGAGLGAAPEQAEGDAAWEDVEEDTQEYPPWIRPWEPDEEFLADEERDTEAERRRKAEADAAMATWFAARLPVYPLPPADLSLIPPEELRAHPVPGDGDPLCGTH